MWEFWIDVGGTFTDCIARSPDGELVTVKVLSSGVTKGTVTSTGLTEPGSMRFIDANRNDPPGFWVGYTVRFLDAAGTTLASSRVTQFANHRFQVDEEPQSTKSKAQSTTYELTSGEPSPILAIRTVLGLKLQEPIPPVSVKLGTTRGTNALLERKGARTAFITTRGFADVLLIANQDRPRLFDLAIQKPEPLFESVVEVDERLDAEGNVLRSPDEAEVRRQLTALHATGVESIAICLLHSFANAEHEQLVERIAREIGFEEISTSSRLSPLIKIVSRGDTTTMDAYLNPVLRRYVGEIRDALGEPDASASGCGDETGRLTPAARHASALKLMTSAGGLVDADNFVGKDSILSGPAGGVIGFSRVAQRAGFDKSIGFDMGGTSTDVARFDGEYETEFETQKAGVRIVSPMLAIETVAAGGGSICGFDGVKLFVGPESAGADPGPACYGAGGPLTVTDVNLYLGKIVPSRFPFPLNRDAVESRLNDLCEQIADSPLGKRYTPIELAEGFTQIANANMVRAIRRISVAKGYDPADYALVTFGGAGAQHACAMANSLGIHAILVHPFAGILSAYGIGLADVRRFGERSVLREYSNETLADLETVFEGLERDATEQVRAEGIPDEKIRPAIRSLDLRYRGVESVINVAVPPGATGGLSDTTGGRFDYVSRYEELHQRLYGYMHAGRTIEIVAARVEVVGETPVPEESARQQQHRIPEPSEITQTWFAGEEHETAVFARSDLQPGDEINGPAIVCEPTSTVVIEPDWTANVRERGELVLTDRRAARRKPVDDIEENNATTPVADAPGSPEEIPTDPVLLEIFNNLFASIAEQMGVTLQRTSFSTNVKERLDFSCAIFSPTGDLVVNAPHIPVHLGAMSETVKAIIADNPDMGPGDVFVTNDPYRGGSHLPDVTVVTPVFDQASIGRQPYDHADTQEAHTQSAGLRPMLASRLLFFTASRAHHAEIGGIVPGSMPPFSKNLAEEGVLIRNFRLIDKGTSREEQLRELLLSGPFPTRSVQDNLADVSAQVAANNSGVQQLRELVDRYSLPVVQAYMGHIQRAAAEKMRLALADFPDGNHRFVDHLDNGAAISVAITVDGNRATVDFTGTSPPLVPPASIGRKPCDDSLPPETPKPSAGLRPMLATESFNLNANRAIVTAAVLYVFRCLINEDIPLNSGVLEPVDIVLPECLLNPPAHDDPARCAAVVGGNVETSQRVVDTLLGALKVAAASQGTMNNLTFGDDAFGYYETICGGSGATPTADGTDAVHTHMTNTRLTDVEVIERRYPVRVHRFQIRRGSGGTGEHPGGDGIIREIEFLKALKVSMLSERRAEFAPFGTAGGQPGQLGRNMIRRASNDEASRERKRPEDLGGKFAIEVQPGDILTIETPGGGGYGGEKL